MDPWVFGPPPPPPPFTPPPHPPLAPPPLCDPRPPQPVADGEERNRQDLPDLELPLPPGEPDLPQVAMVRHLPPVEVSPLRAGEAARLPPRPKTAPTPP